MLIYRKVRAYFWWMKFKKERKGWVSDTIRKYKDTGLFTEEICYLTKYGADYFPYLWSKDKKIRNIQGGGYRSGTDDEPYVLYNAKKLYMDLRAYSQLLLEQNPDSPHRYFTESFNVNEEDVFVDVGGAEGMISLDVVEKAKKVLILECDEYWIDRLRMTFEPWKDKVQIINKYAADYDDDKHVTLDNLLSNISDPVFIKMDVEGMEDIVLAGAQNTLKKSGTKVAICTYHKEGDDLKFESYFKGKGYNTEFSTGVMAMVNDDNTEDRFRRVMLRCWQQ